MPRERSGHSRHRSDDSASDERLTDHRRSRSRRNSQSRSGGGGGGGGGERRHSRRRSESGHHRRRSESRSRRSHGAGSGSGGGSAIYGGNPRRQSTRRDRERRERERERERDGDAEAAMGLTGGGQYERRRSRRRSEAVPADDFADEYRRRRSEARDDYEAVYGHRRSMAVDDEEYGRPDETEVLDEKKGRRQKKKKRGFAFNLSKRSWIIIGVVVLLLALIIGLAVGLSSKKKDEEGSGLGKGASQKNWRNQAIPAEFKGTDLDPKTWMDITDFNLTFTAQKVGTLPVMGLFDDWDDSVQANSKVPPLNEPFPYGKQPIRGVNLGGWLVIEPFITPSFFDQALATPEGKSVKDEYTLCGWLGDRKDEVIERHYMTFVNEDTFKQIRDAGLDHVRIPFGYWIIENEEGDTFLERTGWRYLLRSIEWARKYGLRVKLDPHSIYGGANGWNHSGRQDRIEWLMGPKGDFYGKKTLEMHDKLSKFFAQDRYKNVITMYGLVNEPKMITLEPQPVIDWSEDAYDIIKKNGLAAKVVFGDGFRGLDKWQGEFTDKPDMVLDVHYYTIFDQGLIQLSHTDKIKFACNGWAEDLRKSMDKSTGFGPTFVGEWGQSDTDCTKYLNNVDAGNRWEGTYYPEFGPACPRKEKRDCTCDHANAHPRTYSSMYKRFLKEFAMAQMDTYERESWGWMYWTWDTEDAYQWSYKKGIAAGILPAVAYDREWKCSDGVTEYDFEASY